MLSPQEYIRQFKNSDLNQCIKERDRLMKEIMDFEKDPVYEDDSVPSALTRYLVAIDYLKEMSDVIARKICANKQSHELKTLSSIELRKVSITETEAEAVVNAANAALRAGSGVCGAIFSAAGREKLQQECSEIGHCNTGSAVITSGYDLCDHIIHAVGPIYEDGNHHEAELLHSCYIKSLDLARGNDIRSIAFPLISSGIYGYPKDEAFTIALKACDEWIKVNSEYELRIIFAIIDDDLLDLGIQTARQMNIRISE